MESPLEVLMTHLSVGDMAPDFSLPDHEGVLIRLSDVYRSLNVLLVFNLGYV
jgi:peroxiredoxin